MTWIVHVGGLGWSGSGAILDALLDTDRFVSLKGKPASVSESRLFSGRPDFPTLVSRMSDLSAADVVALWTAGSRTVDRTGPCPRVRQALVSATDVHRINHKVFRTVGDDELRTAADLTAGLVRSATGPAGRASAYLRGTYAAMRSLLGRQGRHVLIDNDPGATPAIAQHLQADERVAFVAVVRDPGDQYVDRRAKAEPGEPVPLNVLRTLRSAVLRRKELSTLADLAAGRPDRLLVVAFERFVRDAGYREQFFERLLGRTSAAEAGRPRLFVADNSVRNIGLTASSEDRLQHATFQRLCTPSHRRVSTHAEPTAWPSVMADGDPRP